MAGTSAGAKKAAAKNKARDPNYYKRIGAEGGKASNKGGFYGNPELASKAGRIGGQKSPKRVTAEAYEREADNKFREWYLDD